MAMKLPASQRGGGGLIDGDKTHVCSVDDMAASAEGVLGFDLECDEDGVLVRAEAVAVTVRVTMEVLTWVEVTTSWWWGCPVAESAPAGPGCMMTGAPPPPPPAAHDDDDDENTTYSAKRDSTRMSVGDGR
jgi:hypothetical protein